ncbi:helix-turn-helix domain-containing protein [Streptomyces sp. NBC_00287]|uniref:IclR family transcriptional regulator domain-containing protein n=1 Tax=Streptomyces sp. NBC_00287 TaxID=2975702 RepID=UPI002E2BD20C|nr:IclR family transcriptional regulator C-terminal domain-containing protein [Streptomyces sp. NBC_00287]
MTTPLAPPATSTVPPEAVTPLIRGIRVLRHLADSDGEVSLRDLSFATELPRSTVDRIAATLDHLGLISLNGRAVTLLPKVMEFGNAYLASVRLPALLGPHVKRLADALDESVSLTVPDGDGLRFIHQVTHRRAMTLSFRIGDLLPIERMAPGPLFAADWTPRQWADWRARLAADPAHHGFPSVPPRQDPGGGGAALEERADAARERGWAIDDQMLEPGLIAIATVVRDADGRKVCAPSVVSHTSRHTVTSLHEAVLPQLRAAVAEMEHTLREAPPAVPEPVPAPDAPRGGAGKQEVGREFVESLARGLGVLTAFGEGRDTLPLTSIAEATGLARATARRSLITFEHLGYVTRDERHYRLTPRVLDLGFAQQSRTTLSGLAAPHLAALMRQVVDSASLAVLVGDDIQYMARAAARRVMSVDIHVGTRLPAYATSMGRVLLAGLSPAERTTALDRTELRALTDATLTTRPAVDALLDRVRDEGYALTDGELEAGLRSLAVPVHDRAGQVIASINVAMHSTRRTLDACLTEVLPALRATATGIERDLWTASRFVQIPT